MAGYRDFLLEIHRSDDPTTPTAKPVPGQGVNTEATVGRLPPQNPLPAGHYLRIRARVVRTSHDTEHLEVNPNWPTRIVPAHEAERFLEQAFGTAT
ncbi:MAG: hypothetical protein PF961_17250 [Planctomycetota bacterium]|jgi:hypothetical protein|nr:hypothetical protein [Planctomycetota bacterium]